MSMNYFDFDFYICNFNTTCMTNECIKSIRQFYNNTIYILDNSNKEKFSTDISNVIVIDNYEDKLLNITNEIQTLSSDIAANHNGFASWKHSYSIGWIINHANNNFMLMDSDTKLIKNFDDIFNNIDDDIATICDLEIHNQFSQRTKCTWAHKTRFMPIFQFFNINNLTTKTHVKNYHNTSYIFGSKFGNYDTGAYFYEYCTNNNVKYKKINHLDYVYHKNHGSWQ